MFIFTRFLKRDPQIKRLLACIVHDNFEIRCIPSGGNKSDFLTRYEIDLSNSEEERPEYEHVLHTKISFTKPDETKGVEEISKYENIFQVQSAFFFAQYMNIFLVKCQ